MQCQECGQRPATVHVTKVVNGQKTEMHLCEQCARQKGELSFSIEPNITFHNMLSSMFELPGIAGTGTYSPPAPRRCPNCGLTYDDFRRIGQLGCSKCYEAFESELEPLLRRLHGATRHTGKLPGGVGSREMSLRRKIQELRKSQAEAIAREEYERAAQLRDQIRSLEESLHGLESGEVNG